MKKIKLLLGIICVCSMLVLSACLQPLTTRTSSDSHHIYSGGDLISIIDINSQAELATLTITNFAVLLDEPFEVLENEEYITYNQIVQIFFVFSVIDSSVNFTSSNFIIRENQTNIRAPFVTNSQNSRFPLVDVKTYNNNNSFIIALRNSHDNLFIRFRYNSSQRGYTASILLDIS